MVDEPYFDSQADDNPDSSPFVVENPDEQDVKADVTNPAALAEAAAEEEVEEEVVEDEDVTVVLDPDAVPEGAENVKVSVGGVDVEFDSVSDGVTVPAEQAKVLVGSEVVEAAE
jgi:hypothetical protein